MQKQPPRQGRGSAITPLRAPARWTLRAALPVLLPCCHHGCCVPWGCPGIPGDLVIALTSRMRYGCSEKQRHAAAWAPMELWLLEESPPELCHLHLGQQSLEQPGLPAADPSPSLLCSPS